MTNLKEPKRSALCPCRSGKSFGECCRGVLRGERPAASAEALMRSRYSAFAVGDVEYLIATLDDEHADRAISEADLRAGLRASARAHRFTGLTVLEAEERGDEAFVTFEARVFERGMDRSFVERSRFRRRADGWRYVSGERR